MSMLQLTEYLLWKSIKLKSPNLTSVKQEFSQNKEEIIEGDMICRVCTNAADIPVTERIDNILIMSAIRTVANISINETDYYPKYVCKNCLEELKVAFNFKRKCEASDVIFRKAISSAPLIDSSSHPMVTHDFQLILHQMKLRRQAQQHDPIKFESDNDNNENYDSSELINSSTNLGPQLSSVTRRTKKIPRHNVLIKFESDNEIDENLKNSEFSSSSTILETPEITPKRLRMSKKISGKNVSTKYESDNDHHDNSENTSAITNSETSDDTPGSRTTKRINVSKKNVKKKKAKRNVGTHIMKLLKNTKINITENITSSINKQSMIKRTKEKKIRDYKCKRCDVKFESEEQMIDHKKNNCYGYHACPLCGKLVMNLSQHKDIVHLRPNKYTCHQCGKVYYSSGALANHLQVHKETFEYSCDHCPYKGKRKSYLVCHMRVHTGEHRYLCSTCPAKFTNPSNLTKHQLMHIGKQFECTKCKKLFRQQKVMQDHYDSAHLNIRYRCSICGRDLSTRKKLLSHELRVHKREKNKLFHEIQKVVVSNEND